MGAYLDRPITEKDSEDGAQGSFKFGSSGMQGWRTNMEDTHVNELNFNGDAGAALFAVFDGHGGSEVAQFCRVNLGKLFEATSQFKEGNYAAALERTFFMLDEAILEGWPGSLAPFRPVGAASRSAYEENSVGCTAVSCFVKDGKLHVANAGDSRIVLCQAGRAVDLSTDHKPELDSERARIEKANGYVRNGRVNDNLNLTRAVGDFAYKKDKSIPPSEQIITVAPEISTQDLLPHDEFIILGCDGVWDRWTSQEVVDFVKPRVDALPPDSNLSPVVEALLDQLISPSITATDGLGCDNMTCVIVDLRADSRNGTVPDSTEAVESSSSPSRTPNPKSMAGMRRPTTVYNEDGELLQQSVEATVAEDPNE